jgi:hemerythrin-like domain-containing protein
MKLTDALLGEHAMLYETFDHLRAASAGGAVGDIRAAMPVLERLLVAHARIEEELLFPSLEPRLGPMGPLAVMRAEHRELDELLRSAKTTDDPAGLRAIVGQLLDLAVNHFRKEETVLFHMAERILDEDALARLGDQWAARRGVTLAPGGCMSAA